MNSTEGRKALKELMSQLRSFLAGISGLLFNLARLSQTSSLSRDSRVSRATIFRFGFSTWALQSLFRSFRWRNVTAAGFLALSLSSRAESALDQRFEFTRPEMGVPFRIVLYAPDEKKARAAAEQAFATVERLNAIFSDYEADSELSRLSQTAGSGQRVAVSPDLWSILNSSRQLSERSQGAFDITIGPCVKLWRTARTRRALPEPALLDQARRSVGYRNLVLDPEKQTAELLLPRMRLDLGGIAKGYAVDKALAALEQAGIRQALVGGAGDLAASEAPPGQSGWRIELPPLEENGPSRFVRLRRAALSTSGDTFQRLEIGGKRYSHIIDPHTGMGLTDQSLVSVIARYCTDSDGLATALSVLGPGAGLKLIENEPGAAARMMRLVDGRSETVESSRFSSFCEPAAP